jgi:PmbA protein
VTCLFGEEVILNSSGLQHVQCGTSVVAAIDTICKGAGIVSTGFEFGNSRKLGLDLSEIGRTAAMLSKNSLHGGSAGTGTGDVLLRPVAFADLLENTFLPAVYADNVQKGRSPLVGKLKESIASAGLSILDDGLLPGGMGSSAVDDEGVPSRRTAVVDGGMLRSFLYDGLSAGKDGLSSTGNAVRSGYADLPRVGARNILIESSAAQDPFEDVKEGVVVGGVIGAHTANPISGDFSVEARNAFHVVDGELAGPIKSAMIAGNIYDLLSGLVVGLDHRAVGSIVVPTVRARMRVVG